MTGREVRFFQHSLKKANYWHGESTHLKKDYDTYENSVLIQLNKQLMNELGYTGGHEHEFSHEKIEKISKRLNL
ncbi:MAG: hypothetical protein ACI9LY_003055 [Arenicella sp.]|jgi:hypothetical protein